MKLTSLNVHLLHTLVILAVHVVSIVVALLHFLGNNVKNVLASFSAVLYV